MLRLYCFTEVSKRSFQPAFQSKARKSKRQKSMQTELRQQQQWIELFSEVTLKIRQSLQLKDILQTTVTEVQRILQADRVLVYHVLPDRTGKTVSEAVLPEYPTLMEQEFPPEVFPEDYQQLYAQGRVRSIVDVHDPAAGLSNCLVEFIQQFGIKAKLIVPIVQTLDVEQGNLAENQLWGLLIAHQCKSVRQWGEFELELMQQLASQISIALWQARLLEHLEEVVTARTVELQAVNRNLQQEIDVRMQAESALHLKDELISTVSHELRTPLTSLHSALKILATGHLGSLSPQGQQMLAIADRSTERLVRLVNNVLDLQRIESGKVMLEQQVCHAANLITQAVEAMQAMAQRHQVTLVTQTEDILIWADADYILQTLTNLLSNAIKFSPPGGKVWLNVTHSKPAPASVPDLQVPEAIFRIRDEGQGIPNDQLEQIFERFQQVNASDRRKGGTGLGLAICRKIIEQHNGRIWAESTLGCGSTFAFTLPVLIRTDL